MSLNAQAPKGKISGVVKDSTGKQLGFATISLYSIKNKQEPIKSTYSANDGKFSIKDVDTGSYKVVISHTGFSSREVDVAVSAENSILVISDVVLNNSGNTLSEIVVTARKPLVEQLDDKIVYNAESDPASKTERAIDILKKTPFVTVDGEDNISVNGQSNFKVLLNGKETSMFANNVKEAMKSFPGALITKIEVITSPSAKYDGEGIGGIINIITKKKVAGYNGSVSAYLSNMWNNMNMNMNIKKGKFGLTMFYFAGGNLTQQVGSSFMETVPSGPAYFSRRVLEGIGRNKSINQNGNAEMAYEFDSLNTVSVYGSIQGWTGKFRRNQVMTTEFASSPDIISYYDLNSRNHNSSKSVGADYIKKFRSNKEREFNFRFNGEFGHNTNFSDSKQDNPGTDRFVINNSDATNKQYTFQADYIHPLKKSRKLESGVKAILRDASSDYSSLIRYNASEAFKMNPANTDYFEYNQDVYSAYSTYSFKVKKTTFRIGARVEHTEVNGNFVSSNAKVKQSYTTLLPNIQGSTKISNALTLVLTYGKRLQRPFIWNLNPFVNNNDSLNISYGNPGLDAQTIHTLSSQIRIVKGALFAGLTFTASYSGNKILQYTTFDPSTGVSRTSSFNLGKEKAIGVAGNINYKITKDWSLNFNGNLQYGVVKNKNDKAQKNSGVGGNGFMNSAYTINKRFNISGYAGFFRAIPSIQASYPLNMWYGIGGGYKFFNEKVTLGLYASNFLQKRWDYKMVITDPNFRTTNINTNPFRAVALNLSWNFGKLTENVSKKKGVTNDDQLGSGQSNN